jgi:hypothetical protein
MRTGNHFLAAALLAVAAPAAAQQHAAPSYRREVPARLLRRATISEDSARSIVMARIPGATVQALELENEHGRLIWSWELKVPGKTGIEEVNVNALDGSIVGVEHEGPAAERGKSARAAPPRPTNAQRLVDRTVAAHPELAAVELALGSGRACRTVAATDPKDVGERCDADELGPMRNGTPDVEAPSASDPVYDITQALHDASGRLIGAVGMDLKPAPGEDRAAAVAKARAILHEMETAIPSGAHLLLAAPAQPGR